MLCSSIHFVCSEAADSWLAAMLLNKLVLESALSAHGVYHVLSSGCRYCGVKCSAALSLQLVQEQCTHSVRPATTALP
jgi:hypothetical protein